MKRQQLVCTKGVFMEIRHIQCFLAVARYKNFRKASEAVYLSQPSISRSIKELEEELGCPLFIRTTNVVRLTDAGERILPECETVMRCIGNIERLKEEEEVISGRFVLGMPPLTALTSLTSILLAFGEVYPDIHIDLLERGPKVVEKLMNRRVIDIGIFTPEEDDPYRRIWFEDDPHDIVVAAGHELAHKSLVTYQDLQGRDIIIYTGDYKLHDAILSHFDRAGVCPGSVMETIQMELMLDMARSRNMVAFIPHKKTQTLGNTFRAVPLEDPDLRLRLAFTWLNSAELQPSAMAFIQFVQRLLSDE